jgi:hypothetical protein
MRIKRVALVENGANFDSRTGDGAHILLYKSAGLGSVHVDSPLGCPCPECDDWSEYEKSTLDADSRSKLPDSAFAAVWTDVQGKKHRKLPIHDAGHLAAARGRIGQAQIPPEVKARAQHRIDAAGGKKEDKMGKGWKGLFKSLTAAISEPDAAKREAMLKEAEAEVELLKDGPPPAPGTPQHENAEMQHIQALQNLHKALGEHIKSYGEGPHPDDHPVHRMKALHEGVGQALKAAGCDDGTMSKGGGKPQEVKMTKEEGERLQKIEKENTDLRAALAVERNIRLDNDVREVLKSFKATPFKLEGEDNDVTRYRALKEADPKMYERTIELMRAQDEMVAKSQLFKSVGTGRSGSGSAWDQIVAKAQAIVEKSGVEMTLEKAIDRVMAAEPGLVKQYRQEQM